MIVHDGRAKTWHQDQLKAYSSICKAKRGYSGNRAGLSKPHHDPCPVTHNLQQCDASNLHKQSHQVGLKYSNIWVIETTTRILGMREAIELEFKQGIHSWFIIRVLVSTSGTVDDIRKNRCFKDNYQKRFCATHKENMEIWEKYLKI